MSTDSSDSLPQKTQETRAITASAGYADAYPIRALIQSIPYVGGGLDTLLAGPGASWRQKRLQEFVQQLGDRLLVLESHSRRELVVPQTEEMHGFFIDTVERVLRTRSEQKRKKFALIAAKQIAEAADWDDADNAIRLLDRLTDFHLAVLAAAAQAPVCSEPFEGLRVITLSSKPNEKPDGPSNLQEMFPLAEPRNLRLACAELVAFGLLSDEGIGRWNAKAFERFVATDTGIWFLSWLDDAAMGSQGGSSHS